VTTITIFPTDFAILVRAMRDNVDLHVSMKLDTDAEPGGLQ
jgi:hypothetical protein